MPRPPAEPGESEFGDSPISRGIAAVLENIEYLFGGAGEIVSSALSTVLDWLLVPFLFLVSLTSFLSAGLAHVLEYAYMVSRPLPDFYCTEPLLVAAITLLIVVRLSVLPFVLRGARKGAEHEQLSPEVRAIQQRYRADRQRQSEEMMKLYKEAGVNPLSSCVPMLLALPLLLALWGLFKGLTIRSEQDTFDPDFLPPGSNAHEYLTQASALDAWGMNLLTTIPEVGLCSALIPYVMVYLLIVCLTFVQARSFARTAVSKEAVVWFNVIAAGLLFTLPMFLMILRLADCSLSLGQAHLIRKRKIATVRRLRLDAESQRIAGETAGELTIDRLTDPKG